ncbi:MULTISPECIES: DeoR/GlpR family DNA-binding transcription regulator [unclassified Ensifer]|uniref:DeoR/GlpR family DNA-binding transcription regulator n=1 Tax=unclassified Ensifer TaxID=2633371 RepID=UPI0009F6129B|nr:MULTISPECIES: DeoR/GlpR family DNA-binding transcription regulator [unclassified Ensifer]
MLTSERKALILKVLRQDSRLVAKSFSQELGVSEDTIRRDLRELAGEGLLQRVHGGALPVSPAAADFDQREKLAPSAKIRLGRAGAQMVRPGQIVFLDGGTTNVQLARHLPLDLKATIITHSPNIAVELARHPSVEVELVGGRLFKHSIVTVGAASAEAISRIRADTYFMGATGLHLDASAQIDRHQPCGSLRRSPSRHPDWQLSGPAQHAGADVDLVTTCVAWKFPLPRL